MTSREAWLTRLVYLAPNVGRPLLRVLAAILASRSQGELLLIVADALAQDAEVFQANGHAKVACQLQTLAAEFRAEA